MATITVTAKKLFEENKVPYPMRLKPSIIKLIEAEAVEQNKGSSAAMIDDILFNHYKKQGKIK
jgi:hypothetical protein